MEDPSGQSMGRKSEVKVWFQWLPSFGLMAATIGAQFLSGDSLYF